MVKNYIGGQKRNQVDSFTVPLTPYDTITISPKHINGVGLRTTLLTDSDEPTIRIVVDYCEQLINSYLERLNNEILLKPIKFAVEHDVRFDGFNIGIKPNRSVSQSYIEFVPQLKELLNRQYASNIIFPRIVNNENR